MPSDSHLSQTSIDLALERTVEQHLHSNATLLKQSHLAYARALLDAIIKDPTIPLTTLLAKNDSSITEKELLKYLLEKTVLLPLARALDLKDFLAHIYRIAERQFTNQDSKREWLQHISYSTPVHQGGYPSGAELRGWAYLTDQPAHLLKAIDRTSGIQTAENLRSLHNAAFLGATRCITALLQNNHIRNVLLNTGLVDQQGNTALHVAVLYGLPGTVQLLLEHPEAKAAFLDKGLRNKDGNTPLHYAASIWRDNMAFIDALLTSPDAFAAMLLVQNKEELSPDMSATRASKPEITTHLIKAQWEHHGAVAAISLSRSMRRKALFANKPLTFFTPTLLFSTREPIQAISPNKHLSPSLTH